MRGARPTLSSWSIARCTVHVGDWWCGTPPGERISYRRRKYSACAGGGMVVVRGRERARRIQARGLPTPKEECSMHFEVLSKYF